MPKSKGYMHENPKLSLNDILFVSLERESIERFLRDEDAIIKFMASITRESRDFRKGLQNNVA